MATKKRLIDANALLIEYCQANGCDEVNGEACPNCFAAGLIAEAPTVDAVEVVHGRWIYGTRAAVCSVCGFERNLDDNFGAAIACPNCGAKMDGERKTDGKE